MKAGNYQIKWSYPKNAMVRFNTVTRCVLLNYKGAFIAESFSICHSGDNFCKATGRKLSLARALKNANLPKEERKEIWEAYRNMTPKPRW